MERLTKIGHKGYAMLKGSGCNYSHVSFDCQVDEGMELLKYALEKLAEYEDLEERIGVPLEELAKLCDKHIPKDCQNPNKAIILTDEDVDRWNEYKNAEEQGLLLRLPCKVGDTVYTICTCEAVDTVLDGTLYGSNGVFGTATGYYCPYELSDKCPHIDSDDCDECKNTEAVFEDTIDYINITECEILIGLKNTNLCVTVDEFGKTVFLTQEEAEQKLKEMEND